MEGEIGLKKNRKKKHFSIVSKMHQRTPGIQKQNHEKSNGV